MAALDHHSHLGFFGLQTFIIIYIFNCTSWYMALQDVCIFCAPTLLSTFYFAVLRT